MRSCICSAAQQAEQLSAQGEALLLWRSCIPGAGWQCCQLQACVCLILMLLVLLMGTAGSCPLQQQYMQIAGGFDTGTIFDGFRSYLWPAGGSFP